MNPYSIGAYIEYLLETVKAGVYVCVAPTGTILRFNRRAVELWGCVPLLRRCEEFFCSSCRLYSLNGQVLSAYHCPIAEALKGNEIHDYRFQFERPNGTRVRVSMNTIPLRRDEERILAVANIFEDVNRENPAELASFVDGLRSSRAIAAHH